MTACPGRPLRPFSHHDACDAAAALLLAGLAVAVLTTFRDYGISNDEPIQQRYGELIIAYYASGFADRSLFELDNLYLYGGLFDVMATLIAKVLPLDIFHVRHLLCAAFGIGGIVATWASARLVAGSRAGLIAAALLAVCGIWYGGMFNHTKDVTFAAAMMGATYALLRTSRDLPHPRLRDVMLFGVMLGMALGLRALGLLVPFYLGVAVLLGIVANGVTGSRARMAFIGRAFVAFMPGLVVAYLIMIAAWPWSALAPFNPVRAIFAFSDFHYSIRDLFAGEIYFMDQMPRAYMPVYLMIKIPLLMLAGLGLALCFAIAPWRGERAVTSHTRYELALLALAALFPVAAHVVGHGPAFSGMRHLMFVVPPIAALAGFGLDAAMRPLARSVAATAAASGIVAALLAWNASILVRLHPHEYLAYNSLVGGLPNAAGRYATDYWSNTMPESVRALEAFLARTVDRPGTPPAQFNVAICAHSEQFVRIAPARLQLTDSWEEAHFFIAPTHMDCDAMLKGEVVATVERLGTLLAVVKDRRTIVDPLERKHDSGVSDPAAALNKRIP